MEEVHDDLTRLANELIVVVAGDSVAANAVKRFLKTLAEINIEVEIEEEQDMDPQEQSEHEDEENGED